MHFPKTKIYQGESMNLRYLLGSVLNSIVLIGPLIHAAHAYCAETAIGQPTAALPLANAAPSHIRLEGAIPPEAALTPSHQQAANANEDEARPNGKTHAMAAAVADGVSTGMALSAGAIESNPLIATSPVGLIAITGLKLGLVNYADTLPEQEKRFAMKSTSAVWGGAAVNNVLVFLAAPPPIAILAGLVTGLVTWTHLENKYDEEDVRLAAKNSKLMAIKAETTVKDPEVVGTSGE